MAFTDGVQANSPMMACAFWNKASDQTRATDVHNQIFNGQNSLLCVALVFDGRTIQLLGNWEFDD
jgi:hypothetical protein